MHQHGRSRLRRTLAVTALAVASGLPPARAVSPGPVAAWGSGHALGQPGATGSLTPVPVCGLAGKRVTAVAAGVQHGLAIVDEGGGTTTVYAWGQNHYGALGDGSTSAATEPERCAAPVKLDARHDLADAVAIAAGAASSFAVRRDGTVWAWGGNGAGQLGSGTETRGDSQPWPAPVRLANTDGPDDRLTGATKVAASTSWTLVLARDRVYSMGLSAEGALGNGTTGVVGQTSLATPVLSPTGSRPLSGVTDIAAGNTHALALVKGTVYGWGDNRQSEVSPACGSGCSLPVLVGGQPVADPAHPDARVVGLAGGGGHSMLLFDTDGSLATTAERTVYAWGDNSVGQQGNGTTSPAPVPGASTGLVRTPTQVTTTSCDSGSPLTGVAAIAAGSAVSIALASNGAVWAWGSSTNGQTGNITDAPAPGCTPETAGSGFSAAVVRPIRVAGVSAARRVAAALRVVVAA